MVTCMSDIFSSSKLASAWVKLALTRVIIVYINGIWRQSWRMPQKTVPVAKKTIFLIPLHY